MSERLKETDCKSVGYAYVGSNPTSPIKQNPTMNTSKIKTATQLMAVMNRMDPLGKDGVLLLQAMSNDGKDDIVREYAKLFDRIQDE